MGCQSNQNQIGLELNLEIGLKSIDLHCDALTRLCALLCINCNLTKFSAH